MRVFITGAAGFIGTATTKELIANGHQVVGLARSDANAGILKKLGAEVHRGSLEDLESLRAGAATADGVIHLAFIHDFSKFAENGQIDKRAIEAMGEVMAGTDKPMVVSSGTAMVAPGRLATEDMRSSGEGLPRVSEQLAFALADKGIRSSAIRLAPAVHGMSAHLGFRAGFVSYAMQVAQEKGVSAYVGDGANRWNLVHVGDAARLYRLALEKGQAGAAYHAVGEEGIPVKDIAEMIGRKLNLPVESIPPEKAGDHFGFLGMFLGLDLPVSSSKTQVELGWKPMGPTLLADLETHYFAT
jgi:nucleoside-diphosphate-sugar epimerase